MRHVLSSVVAKDTPVNWETSVSQGLVLPNRVSPLRKRDSSLGCQESAPCGERERAAEGPWAWAMPAGPRHRPPV